VDNNLQRLIEAFGHYLLDSRRIRSKTRPKVRFGPHPFSEEKRSRITFTMG
jgi:hypothetical protein